MNTKHTVTNHESSVQLVLLVMKIIGFQLFKAEFPGHNDIPYFHNDIPYDVPYLPALFRACKRVAKRFM